jgi:hypothetical protein
VLEDPFKGGPGSAAPPPPAARAAPPPPARGAAAPAPPPARPGAPVAESELDRSIKAALDSGAGLWASLFAHADLGVEPGADDATAAAALKRAGITDLTPDKIRALIARARSGS